MAKSRSTPPSAAQKRLAADRAAAARERIAAAQRRRRLLVILAAVGTVVVVIAAFVVIKVALGNDLKSGKKAKVAQQSLTQTLASVPPSVFDKIGVGGATAAPQSVGQPSLGTSKPEVLYIGAEYCPYCAAERWPVTVALLRFGSFRHLSTTFSSPDDTVNPDTPTLSFHGATYTSKYLTFVGKETQSNQISGNNYAPLDKLTPAQEALFKKDANGIPFVDFNGTYVLNAAQYDGKILLGKTQAQIAKEISDPSTEISKDVVGSANILTARLCQVTKNQPVSVCSSSGVQTAAAKIASSSSGS